VARTESVWRKNTQQIKAAQVMDAEITTNWGESKEKNMYFFRSRHEVLVIEWG
jgi:hypothetical protein